MGEAIRFERLGLGLFGNSTWYQPTAASVFLLPNAKPLPDIDSQFIIQHVAFLVDGHKFDGVVAGLRAKGVRMDPVEDTGIAYSVHARSGQ